MKFAFSATGAAFFALALRGLAPVAAWGGWTTILLLEALALGVCLGTAWRLRREGAASARRDPVVFLLLAHFPIWALSYFTLGANHGVDAINHLEYIRSAVFDHDLDVGNDDAIFGGATGDHPEIDTTQVNMHGIGPAMVWAPLYLVAHSLCGVIGQACNGASRPYLAACTLTSMFLSSLGLVFAYRLALRFASRGASLLAVLGVAWGTFLAWYLTIEPTMSHNLSFATAALTFLLIQRGPRGARGWFVVGLTIGFSACVRFANALLGAAALPAVLFPSSPERKRDTLKNAAALALGACVAFLPQMFAWQQMFGSPLLIPNGEGFLANPPELLDLLFSPHGGLLTWSPVLYLAIPGLLAFRRLGSRTAIGFWAVIVLLYLTNARVPDWWGGSSFGNRRFCTVLPAMAVGMAITADALARFARRRPLVLPAAAVVIASLWNLLLAEGHREWAWAWGEPASFPQMARVVVDQIGRRIGSPFALPAALIESVRNEQGLADYEASRLTGPYATATVRFGDDDLPFLAGGFTVPQGGGDSLHRSTSDGRLRIWLREPLDYGLGVRWRGHEGQTLLVELNGTGLGSCPPREDTGECEFDVPASSIRAGVNEVRLTAAPGSPGVQLHAFWMKPKTGGPARTPPNLRP